MDGWKDAWMDGWVEGRNINIYSSEGPKLILCCNLELQGITVWDKIDCFQGASRSSKRTGQSLPIQFFCTYWEHLTISTWEKPSPLGNHRFPGTEQARQYQKMLQRVSEDPQPPHTEKPSVTTDLLQLQREKRRQAIAHTNKAENIQTNMKQSRALLYMINKRMN